MRRRVLIMGAAGRDFHNFNVAYRDDPSSEVVGFTAAHVPFVDRDLYPPELAGSGYPNGIPIRPEEDLESMIRELHVDDVVFAYSDVTYEYVMHRASRALAAGANFSFLGPEATFIDAHVPVVAVCAVRTGSGKSQTTRAVAALLRDRGLHPVVVRHPMPYRDLVAGRVQRFSSFQDLDDAQVTIEEREEYEHLIVEGIVVYSGVDFEEILEQAEQEGDVLVFDGGKNDLPFYRPTVHIVLADPLRAGDERGYHPGETNVRMADVVIINKVNTATPEQVARVERSVRLLNPEAVVIHAASTIDVDRPDDIGGRRVLVIEDGPTLTHGGMAFGAGVVAARRHGAAELVDPRPFVRGNLADVFAKYEVGSLLPAEGYSPEQLEELRDVVERVDPDLVVIATPIDLRHVIPISKPAVRVGYRLEVLEGSPSLESVLVPLIERARADHAASA